MSNTCRPLVESKDEWIGQTLTQELEGCVWVATGVERSIRQPASDCVESETNSE